MIYLDFFICQPLYGQSKNTYVILINVRESVSNRWFQVNQKQELSEYNLDEKKYLYCMVINNNVTFTNYFSYLNGNDREIYHCKY